MEQSPKMVRFIITGLRVAAVLVMITALVIGINASHIGTAAYYGGGFAYDGMYYNSGEPLVLVLWLIVGAMAAIFALWAAEMLNSLQVVIGEMRSHRAQSVPQGMIGGGDKECDSHGGAAAGLSGGNDSDADR